MAAANIIIDLMLKTGAFETDTKRAQKRWQNFTKEIKDGAMVVGGALSAAFAVGKAVPLMDEYSQMAARIKNATRSAQEYNAVQARLQQSAAITYRKISEAGEGFLAFATPMQALGRSMEEVLDLTDSLSFSFTANAARADQAQSAQDALAKSMAKGRVDANAWISILTAADNTAAQVAKTMGVTEAEVRRLGAEGKLSLNDLVDGLIAAKDENQKLAENMSASVQDGMTSLTNSITVFLGRINETYGITAKTAAAMVALGDNIDNAAAVALVFAGVYGGRVVAAHVSVVAARVKDIAAAAAQARANHGVASAATVAAAAQARAAAAGRAALAFVGGWVGLAVTLASVAGGYLLLKGAADDTTDSLDDQQKSIAELAAEYQKLSEAQRFLKADEIRRQLDGLTDSIKSAVGKLETVLTDVGAIGVGSGQMKAGRNLLDQFNQGLIDSNRLLKEMQETGVFTDRQIQSAVKAAAEVENYRQKQENANKVLRLATDESYRLAEAAKAGKDGTGRMAGGLREVAAAAKSAQEAVARFNDTVLGDIAVAAVKLEMLKRGYSENIAQKVAEFTVKTNSKLDGDAAKAYLEQQKALEGLTRQADKYTESVRKNQKALEEQAKYVMPYSGSYRITSGIGLRNTGIPGASKNHKGVDIAMPIGTPVKAMAAGTIENRIDSKGLNGGFGRYVVIKFDDGTRQIMGHLSKFLAKSGTRVQAGEVVALSGDSGVGRAHLHNEIRDKDNKPVDFRSLVGKAAPNKEQNEVAEKILRQAQEHESVQQRINQSVKDYVLQQREAVALLGKEGEYAKLKAQIEIGMHAEKSKAQQDEMLRAAKLRDIRQQAYSDGQKYFDLVKEFTAPAGMEKFTADLELANRALEEGVINMEQYQRWVEKISADNPVPYLPEPKNTAVGEWVENAKDVTGAIDSAWASMLGSMTDGITEFVTTGKGSLRDFMIDVIKMFVRIAVARQIAGFVSSAFGGGGFSFGGSGAGAGSMNALFAEGGYTGAGGKYEPAGIVHRGEVVFSQDDVRRFGGVANVEAMRLRGYAVGGVVGGLPGGGKPAAAGGTNITVNVTVEGGDTTEEQVANGVETGMREAMKALAKAEIAESWRPGNISYNMAKAV